MPGMPEDGDHDEFRESGSDAQAASRKRMGPESGRVRRPLKGSIPLARNKCFCTRRAAIAKAIPPSPTVFNSSHYLCMSYIF